MRLPACSPAAACGADLRGLGTSIAGPSRSGGGCARTLPAERSPESSSARLERLAARPESSLACTPAITGSWSRQATAFTRNSCELRTCGPVKRAVLHLGSISAMPRPYLGHNSACIGTQPGAHRSRPPTPHAPPSCTKAPPSCASSEVKSVPIAAEYTSCARVQLHVYLLDKRIDYSRRISAVSHPPSSHPRQVPPECAAAGARRRMQPARNAPASTHMAATCTASSDERDQPNGLPPTARRNPPRSHGPLCAPSP